jgi:hypothetical protein
LLSLNIEEAENIFSLERVKYSAGIESIATKAVGLMHPVLVLAEVCTIKSGQIYGQDR